MTVKGEWRKKSATAPTRLFGPDGKPITLTAGQTFVQVIDTDSTYTFKIRDGEAAAAARSRRGSSACSDSRAQPQPVGSGERTPTSA